MTVGHVATLLPSAWALSPSLLAAVVGAIALLMAVRQAVAARRRGDAGWRLALLVAAQFALAALLWLTLAPPLRESAAGTLVVATAATSDDLVLAAGERLVALPEAPALAGAERVPDLGTALRRHPQTQALRVLGAGLPARDRDAARGRAVAFVAPALPAGIVELQAPLRLPAGRRFSVSGRVEGGAGQRLELLDPAGSVRARQDLADDGRFALASPAGPAGRIQFHLQRRDAAGAVVETLALPLSVDTGARLRLLVLAGGVNAETKFLRRWALDAGFELTTMASVGGGVDLGQPVAINAARLAEFDLVVLDERSWRGLGAGGRATLRAAVRDGLGVLLRLAADPSEDDRATLRDWGFALAAGDFVRELQLPGSETADGAAVDAGADADADAAEADAQAAAAAAATDLPPPLSRRAWRIAAADGTPLLRAADGEPLAVWRAEGRGRIAVWNLGDTFRLQLGGRRGAYGELWSAATGTLARARGVALADITAIGRVGERSVVCAIPANATVAAPDAATTPLLPDPASGAAACAAFWPALPGWHSVGDRLLFVRAADEAPGLAAAELRDATLALTTVATPNATLVATQPGERWPWFLAWLLTAALLWWFERARLGRRLRVIESAA